ncbi:hypothetical protein [Sphingomicrobium aestuariivivum]|uniref:hypothetical protein n=1 Tax=Sphingomicrobium aestuariivivum TaxID=1582356 RepID=UPI001FD67AC7|nr:hypothetical protein [Sphingomicrobium aestuariivivum]MCJ8190148.1 hypothetical protein [Sphingomicrobium aestuariivivum]
MKAIRFLLAAILSAWAGGFTFLFAMTLYENDGAPMSIMLEPLGWLIAIMAGFAPALIGGIVMTAASGVSAKLRAPASWAVAGAIGGVAAMLMLPTGVKYELPLPVLVASAISGLAAALVFRAVVQLPPLEPRIRIGD